MKSVFNIYSFLKTLLFIFLFSFAVSTVLAENRPSEAVVQYAGKGLSSEIMLTKQEQAWLDRRLTVRVRVSDSPPFQMTHPGPQGISVDYLKLIGKRFGINFNFVKNSEITWKGAVDDLTGERKRHDLLPFIKRTRDREQDIAFTQDYFLSPWVVINRTDSEFVTRMQDLNGKKVAVENGFVVMDLIKKEYPQIRIVPCNTSLEALQSVASGGSDAYIANLTIASYLIQSNGLNNLKIAAPTPFGSHDIAMGVRKDWPELASIIDKGLTAMSDAEENEIRNRWLSIRYEYGVNMKKVLMWAVGLTAAFSLAIAVIFIWNRRLKREINQRIITEEALQKSQSLLAQAEELGRVGGWEFDIDTRLLTWTKTVYDIHEADITGQQTVEQGVNFYTPASLPVIKQAVQRAIEQGEPFDLELEIITAKGNLRSVRAVGKADLARGKVFGFFQDITGRKQAEEAMQVSEERFRIAVESANDVVYEWDLKQSIQWFGQIDEMLGYGKHEFPRTFDGWVAAVHPEDREQVKTAVQAHLQEHVPYDTEYRVRKKDGAWRWWSARGAAVCDSAGTPSRLIGTITDITERKQAEEALLQSRRAALNMMRDAAETRDQAQMYLDVAGFMIAVLNAEGCVVLINRKGCEILGYTEQEITGQNWFNVCLPEEMREEVTGVFNELIAGEIAPVEYYENPVLAKDGKYRTIAFHNAVLRDQSSQIIGILFSGEDITERKQAEEEIRTLNAELEQRVHDRTAQLEAANKELEAFSYSVSHDLRAPLRGIDGFSHILLDEYRDTLDEKAKDCLNRVRAGSQRMGELIDDLLKLSRVSRAEIQYETVNLSSLAHMIAEELNKAHPERHVEFVIADNASDRGDPHLLRIALENLFGNAHKFTRNNAHAKIDFSRTTYEGKPAYYIRDNGVGFEMEFADKLFGAFQRLHARSEFEGTGIGLATVQRIIHKHGGSIWAEAEVGKGAIFYFTLKNDYSDGK